MAFDLLLEPDEQVSADIPFYVGREQRRLVLTNRAAYWPSSKFGFIDGIVTERMPLAEVVSVSIRDVWHRGKLLVGGIMLVSGVIIGVIGVFLVFGGFVAARVGNIFGFVGIPLSSIGLAIAVHGGRRRTLVIASKHTSFTWAEPHVLFGDGPGCSLFEQVRAWAQSNGLRLEVDLEK